jgi:hypothetical protein
MRQHKILTRTLLILSILNFALAAPVAVREGFEVRLDANVTRNVTTASQNRRGQLDGAEGELPPPNLVYSPPPSPVLEDTLSQMAGQLAEQHGYTDSQPPPSSLGSSKGPRLPVASSLSHPPESLPLNVLGSDHVPPQSAVLTNTAERHSLGSLRFKRPASSLSHPPEIWPPKVPVSDHAPPKRLKSAVLADIMSQIKEQLGHRYHGNPQPSPGSLESSTGPRLPVGSTSVASSLSTPLNPSPLPSQPGQSKNHVPRPPVLSGGQWQAIPPQSQGVDAETHSSSLTHSEPFSTEVLDTVLKGKFKRHISSSDAAQKETRSRTFHP